MARSVGRFSATPDDPLALVVLCDDLNTQEQRAAELLLQHFLGDPRNGLDRGLWINVIPVTASSVPDLTRLRSEIGNPSAIVVVAFVNSANSTAGLWTDFWNGLTDWLAGWTFSGVLVPVQFEPLVQNQALSSLNHVRLNSLDEHSKLDLLKRVSLACAQCLRFSTRRRDPKYNGFNDAQVNRTKDQIFISHSKHDHDKTGVKTALRIRNAISTDVDVTTFFDVANIRPGEDFADAILQEVADSLLIAVHTDTYSSREWCRKEVLAAKQHERPAVVAGCVRDIDRRSFPYMGNTPYVALRSLSKRRVDQFVLRVFDEMLAHYIWLARVAPYISTPSMQFLARAPELISLASTLLNIDPAIPTTVVYPDPPIGEEEKRLIEALRANLVLLSYTEWRAT